MDETELEKNIENIIFLLQKAQKVRPLTEAERIALHVLSESV